jgi:hypothetical protein
MTYLLLSPQVHNFKDNSQMASELQSFFDVLLDIEFRRFAVQLLRDAVRGAV